MTKQICASLLTCCILVGNFVSAIDLEQERLYSQWKQFTSQDILRPPTPLRRSTYNIRAHDSSSPQEVMSRNETKNHRRLQDEIGGNGNVTIRGMVFNDFNQNTIRDTMGTTGELEPGFPSMLIQLRSCNESTPRAKIMNFRTDTNGEYEISDFGGTGCYYLQFDISRYDFTTDLDNGRTEFMELDDGDEILIDVGVLVDENATVVTTGSPLDESISTVTASVVETTIPASFGTSVPGTTGTSTALPNGTISVATTVTTVSGSQTAEVSNNPASLGGTIYHDVNDNLTRDMNALTGELETGIQGIIVELRACEGDTLIDTRFTNSVGQYLFGNFGPGGCYYLSLYNGENGSDINYSFRNGGKSGIIILEDGDYEVNWNFAAVIDEEPTTSPIFISSNAPSRMPTAKPTPQSSIISTIEPTMGPTKKFLTSKPTIMAPSNATAANTDYSNSTDSPTINVTVEKPTPSPTNADVAKPTSSPTNAVTSEPSIPPTYVAAVNRPSVSPSMRTTSTSTSPSTVLESPSYLPTDQIDMDWPTYFPTDVPTIDQGTVTFEITIDVSSKIRVQLENMSKVMSSDAVPIFQSACATFLNNQLSIATPPIYDIECSVASQSLESVRRQLEQNEREKRIRRRLVSSLVVDVDITGVVDKTNFITEASQIKFKDIVTGTFTVQGSSFIQTLEIEENQQKTMYFNSIESVRGIQIYDAAEAQEVDGGDLSAASDDGRLSKGVIAGIILGCVVFLMMSVFILARVLEKRCPTEDAVGKVETARTIKRPKEDFFASVKQEQIKSRDALQIAPTKQKRAPDQKNLQTRSSASTTVSPRSETSEVMSVIAPMSVSSGDVEIGLIPPSFSGVAPKKNKGSSITSGRVQRDVMAPAGKLGLMVANTAGFGPAVHTIKEGSPMEGLIFVNDIIIAINDIDTREWKAEQVTKLMKETVENERKITVLSSHR
mmetsp:Transcript_29013/g.60365  ORF Transcript_29013/g.60365 Transcript_29013/m.60365 type:complete len:950 (+) Transcript_29013:337-3186(+)